MTDSTTSMQQRRARLDAAKALRFTTGINPATGVFDTPVERELYRLAGTCWNHMQGLIADLDLYVGHEPTLAEEALYEHEQALRARIAEDVNRARRPVFADGERPDVVVRTTRAIDVRIVTDGPDAPYWVPEGGDPS